MKILLILHDESMVQICRSINIASNGVFSASVEEPLFSVCDPRDVFPSKDLGIFGLGQKYRICIFSVPQVAFL